MHIVAWAALAGWVAPVVLAGIAAVVVRLSPRLRAKLLGKIH